MNSYELSRKWFDFCFENPEKVKPNHSALYMFAIEHCNRLGWKEKFGFPTEMAKDAIGIKNYRTYINTLNDLVEWGFIKMIEKSKNQYSANIIALANYTKASTKALDKASIKHLQKQCKSTYKSIDSIIKHITINQLNIEHIIILKNIISKFEKENNIENNIEIKKNQKEELLNSYSWIESICMKKKYRLEFVKFKLKEFLDDQELKENINRPLNELKSHFLNWLKDQKDEFEDNNNKIYIRKNKKT